MIPTAMSTTLPRMANCLNSCNIFFIKQRFLYYNNKISHKLKIVSSIVADLIMPAVGLLVGGVNFTDLKITLKHAVTFEH